MPSVNGIDFGNISSIKGVPWSLVSNIVGVSVSHAPTSPYKFYYSSLPSTTSPNVTNTTSNTILNSVLIPSNTFDVGGVLECLIRIRKSGTASVYTWRIYTNIRNSLTGASLLAENVVSTGNVFYNETIRYFSLSRGSLNYLGVYQNQTDLGVGASTTSLLSSIPFNLSVDNYIISAIQPSSSSADIIYEDITLIRGYE